MLVYRFVGTGPLRKVDTRECISRKNEPWGSLYNDKKSEKKQRLEKFRPLHVINDNSYCRALLRMTASSLCNHMLGSFPSLNRPVSERC